MFSQFFPAAEAECLEIIDILLPTGKHLLYIWYYITHQKRTSLLLSCFFEFGIIYCEEKGRSSFRRNERSAFYERDLNYERFYERSE